MVGGREAAEVVFLRGNLCWSHSSQLQRLIRKGSGKQQAGGRKANTGTCVHVADSSSEACHTAQVSGTPTLGPTLDGSLASHSPALAPQPAPRCHRQQGSGAGHGRQVCPVPPRRLPLGCPPGGRERGPLTQTPIDVTPLSVSKEFFPGTLSYFFFSLKKLQMVTTAMKLKDTPWKESYDHPRQHIKKQRHYFVNKGLSRLLFFQ